MEEGNEEIMSETTNLITLAKAAQSCKKPPAELEAAIQRQEMKATKIRKEFYVYKTDLERWLAGPPPTPPGAPSEQTARKRYVELENRLIGMEKQLADHGVRIAAIEAWIARAVPCDGPAIEDGPPAKNKPNEKDSRI
ncbi:MAG: hypothetical protein KAY37_00995 [Phycisphaerae bacterium]|nr:hypothetical protein [Phycisphaerae bacterium]